MDKYILGLILSVVIGPLVGYYVHKLRTRTDTDARNERAPLEILQTAINMRDQEILRSQRELSTAISAHAKEDTADRTQERESRERFITVLVEQTEVLRNLSKEVVEHRKEERERVAHLHTRLNDIHRDIFTSRRDNGDKA